MEENRIEKKPVSVRDSIVNWGIAAFFGFYMTYLWLSTDDAKGTLIAAFGAEFFAITKATVLLMSMGCAILGGYRLFKILMKLKKSIKFIDVSEEENK